MYTHDAVPAWLIFDDTFRSRHPWTPPTAHAAHRPVRTAGSDA
jgi:hypothetical protein